MFPYKSILLIGAKHLTVSHISQLKEPPGSYRLSSILYK